MKYGMFSIYNEKAQDNIPQFILPKTEKTNNKLSGHKWIKWINRIFFFKVCKAKIKKKKKKKKKKK